MCINLWLNSSNVSPLFLLIFRSVFITFVEKYFDVFVYKPVRVSTAKETGFNILEFFVTGLYTNKSKRKLRSDAGFVLAPSAHLLVLLSLLANLTGLTVLVLLLTSFASHCYFLRHRVFWFWIVSIVKCYFIFWLKMD